MTMQGINDINELKKSDPKFKESVGLTSKGCLFLY